MSTGKYIRTEEIKKKISETLKKNPIRYWLGKNRSEETKRKISENLKGKRRSPNTEFKKGRIAWNKNIPMKEENKNKLSQNQKGHWTKEKNPNWNNGSSYEPYGYEFNLNKREQIRKRDNYRCQECFRHQNELRTRNNKPYKLQIHHIDYNKRNNQNNNLISLCRNCHSQTNFQRENWIKYFNNKL